MYRILDQWYLIGAVEIWYKHPLKSYYHRQRQGGMAHMMLVASS